jgi:predicted CoA-binding protein
MSNTKKKTLVLGASTKPSRYSNLAINRLINNQHPVFAIGKKAGTVAGVVIETAKVNWKDIDTITLYLSADHQKEYYDYILSLHPQRLIFNPGSENDELAEIAVKNYIKSIEACTLVLLSTGQY